MQQYRPTGFKLLPDVVKNLIIINALMLLASYVMIGTFGINLWEVFGLHWVGSEQFEPYQLITYMFMHGGFGHFFFNMFAVWMLGSAIENTWGQKRFLTYYLLTGLGAAFTHYVIVYFIDLAPAQELMNAFINNPGSDTLTAFLNEYKFTFDPERNPAIYDQYQNSVDSIRSVLAGSSNAIELDTAR